MTLHRCPRCGDEAERERACSSCGVLTAPVPLTLVTHWPAGVIHAALRQISDGFQEPQQMGITRPEPARG